MTRRVGGGMEGSPTAGLDPNELEPLMEALRDPFMEALRELSRGLGRLGSSLLLLLTLLGTPLGLLYPAVPNDALLGSMKTERRIWTKV